jgi:RNA polymerase sigma-70 factor (ECF subfamily)
MVLATADRLLIEAASVGDERAFEELMRRHGARVYRVALRMMGSAEDAEEATQDAWLAAWRALPRFRRESTFTTWLYRIVTNRCLGSPGRQRPTESLSAEIPDRALQADDQAELHARLVALTQAILVLTPEQRAPLVLRELEGLPYEEIADVLGVSVEAVKSRIHRARASLWKGMRSWR